MYVLEMFCEYQANSEINLNTAIFCLNTCACSKQKTMHKNPFSSFKCELNLIQVTTHFDQLSRSHFKGLKIIHVELQI